MVIFCTPYLSFSNLGPDVVELIPRRKCSLKYTREHWSVYWGWIFRDNLVVQCFQLKEWIFLKLLYRPSLQSFNIHIPFLHHPNNVCNSKTACLENGKWTTALFSFTLIYFAPFLLTSRFCGSSSLNVAS